MLSTGHEQEQYPWAGVGNIEMVTTSCGLELLAARRDNISKGAHLALEAAIVAGPL